MPRNPMQDIVPKGSRSIRKVPVPESRQRTLPKKEHLVVKEEPEEKIDVPVRISSPLPDLSRARREPEPVEEADPRVETLKSVREEFEVSRTSRSKRKKQIKAGLIALGVLAVLILAVFVSNLFHSAVLSLTPRVVSASVSGDLTARKSGAGLAYESVSLKEIGSLPVKATGEEAVSKKATGTIIIYNDYNASAQRLIKNTRFETTEGLIFRISDSVTVPGKKGTTPGSVEATVVADEAGEKYNVGLKDFTIPGFKGDPRYSSFYARSKTPLAGGFVGTRKIVSEADRKKAESVIEAEVSANLLKKAASEVPADKIFFDKAYSISFVTLPEEASGNEVLIKKEGTLSFALFDKGEISKALAQARVQGYEGEPIMVKELEALAFAPKGEFDPGSSDSVSFSLSGDAKFEWLYEEASLKAALAGLSRSDIPAALQGFPMIEKADISIRPFWSRSFPESVDRISIERSE
ncbi:MAG: hypothetical protein HZA81_00395 [Candidatus Taylorbacteria bacterium]|nr:hypothetical protein [Candidatus Taylorbacteria bacterium]